MALARLFRGKSADFTPERVELHDGYMYVVLDDRTLWFDSYVDGVLKRQQITGDAADIDAAIEAALKDEKGKDLYAKVAHADTHKTGGTDELTPADIGAAAEEHGEHVPEPETANNAKFLRNDNTWQTVTPENIGAVPQSVFDDLGLGNIDTDVEGFVADLIDQHESSTNPHPSWIDSALSTTSEKPVQNKVVTAALDGKAAASHGTHVPTPETANNAKFLRNDNTWQTVTPANIGAAASSHNQAASTITAGTFAGAVYAGVQTPGTSLLRNSKLVSTETTPTVEGEIYWVYG